jgi:RNA polymerase sigma-70 factor, ECF subfamily
MTTKQPLDDLIKKAQLGDQAPYEELLKTVVTLALPFLKKQNISEFDCDDIIQNTLIAVHKNLATYHPKHSAKAWLYAIIRYKLMDYFRQKYRANAQEFTDELDLLLLSSSLEEDMINSERKRLLDHALTQLNQSQEKIIRLMKLEGLSAKEVAQKVGLSETNVKVIAFRGYKKLAKLLGNDTAFLGCIFLCLFTDIVKGGG